MGVRSVAADQEAIREFGVIARVNPRPRYGRRSCGPVRHHAEIAGALQRDCRVAGDDVKRSSRSDSGRGDGSDGVAVRSELGEGETARARRQGGGPRGDTVAIESVVADDIAGNRPSTVLSRRCPGDPPRLSSRPGQSSRIATINGEDRCGRGEEVIGLGVDLVIDDIAGPDPDRFPVPSTVT